jgi:uncharacterized protein YjbI with pentapeptide repeats
MAQTNFDDATLTNTDLSRANLIQARFVGAKMERVSLKDTNVREGDFSHATCIDTDFVGANLQYANFHQVQGNYSLSKVQQASSLGTDEDRLTMEKRLGVVA